MREVRAILVDPFACEIKEVRHEADDYKKIYEAISHESMPVNTFDVVRFDDGDAMFIDDEGAMKHAERAIICRHFGRPPWPLFGKGLILGSDDNGDTQDCKITLNVARHHFTFGHVQYDEAGEIKMIYHAPTTPWMRDAPEMKFLTPEEIDQLLRS